MGFSRIVDKNAAQICRVTSIYELLEDIARQYGSMTMAIDAECDTEIAEYASTNPAVLAVLAEDSDFLIFPGNWRYFSLRYLDRNSLITNEYNRRALRHELKLNDKELACLSTIGGNNFIENTTNCNQIYQKFTKIAKCIKLSNFKTLNEEDLSKIINTMLNNIPTNTTLMQIKKSLEFYHTDFMKTDLRSEHPFIYKCLQHNMRFVYNILSEFPVNFTLYYYDLKKEPISYYDLIIPLFKRKIGILHNHRCQLRCNYYVYSKLSHLRSFERLKVDPIFPNQSVPPLTELLFAEDNDALDQVRFNLLKEIIGISPLLDIDLKPI